MIKILFTLILSLWAIPAAAQCTGVFPPNTICGNNAASAAPPKANSFSFSGTINSGTAGQFAFYASSGTTISGTSSLFSGISANEILMSNGSGGFSDSTFSAATCSGCSGANYLQLPVITMTGGGSIIFGNFGSPGFYNQDGHEFIGCFSCQVNTSAGGSTALVGYDGSNTPILGGAVSGGFHMSALGSSVVCQADEAVCIGHAATAKGPSDIIIGGAGHTVANGTDILLGGTTDTSSVGNHISIGSSTISGTSNSDILILPPGSPACTLNNVNEAIGIGFNACPSATFHALFGGSLTTDFYAGNESNAAAIHGSTVIQNGPKTETANYNPIIGDNSIIFNCTGTCSMGLGNVATTGYKLRIRTIANQAVNAIGSIVVPLAGGAPGNSILTNTAGKWADIEYDGTNWQIMASN